MKQRDTSSSTVSIEDDDNEMIGDAVDEDILGRDSPAFITVENEKGVLEHVQINLEEFEEDKQEASYFNLGFGDNNSIHPLERNGSIPNTKSIKDYKKNSRRRIVSKTGQCHTQLFRVHKKKTRLLKVRQIPRLGIEFNKCISGCIHHNS